MYHIIVNPLASFGHGKRKLMRAEKYLKKRNAEYRIHRTSYAGHATQIARELSEAGETEILVFGGDGTVNEVLNGLVNSENVHLGILAGGTANDFVSYAKMPKQPEKMIDLILRGEPKRTDYIVCGKYRSLNSVGTGIDVDVLQRCRGGKGKGRYWVSLLQSVCSFRGNDFVARYNGEEKSYHAFLAVLCNGGMFGGGIRICPDAKLDEGKLKLVIVDYMSGFRLLRALFALISGRILKLDATTCVDVESVEILPKKSFILQLDGELYGNIPFRAHVEKGGIWLYR